MQMVLFTMVKDCVPHSEVKKELSADAHSFRYYVHLGSTMMYHGLRQHFWWHRMKKEIVRYVSRYLVY